LLLCQDEFTSLKIAEFFFSDLKQSFTALNKRSSERSFDLLLSTTHQALGYVALAPVARMTIKLLW